MLIIGERINTSRPDIKRAVETKDANFIQEEVRRQKEAGALMIDVNSGSNPDTEVDDMLWLIDIIQEAAEIPLCIDSPNFAVLEQAMRSARGRALLNSVTAEKSRYEKILPICKEFDCDIICLTMDEKGMPATSKERFEIATIMMEICSKYQISKDRLYFDPLVRPVSSEQGQAMEFLGAIKMMKSLGLKTIAGLSNVSFGLPKRRLLNRTFLSMACSYGLDACIVDPLDSTLMSAITASSAILGHDDYCMEYLGAYRGGRL